jgi:hypothetical protein
LSNFEVVVDREPLLRCAGRESGNPNDARPVAKTSAHCKSSAPRWIPGARPLITYKTVDRGNLGGERSFRDRGACAERNGHEV